MARMPRLAIAGQPHLLVQRGQDGRPVFRDDADRLDYLNALQEVTRAGTVALHAYALLDDSVLLLATPRGADDLGTFMQRVSRRYVPAHHRRHGGSGPLWAGRFQAAVLEPERYLLLATLLIEQAPVRAGSVTAASDDAWSSARHHTGRASAPWITEHELWWGTGNTPFEREAKHEAALGQMLNDGQVAELESATRRGAAIGSSAFIAAVGEVSGRVMVPRPRGRPPR